MEFEYSPVILIDKRKNISYFEFDTFKKLVIFRLITPISMKIMDENDRKSIVDLIRLVYISDYNTILKNICNYYKNVF